MHAVGGGHRREEAPFNGPLIGEGAYFATPVQGCMRPLRYIDPCSEVRLVHGGPDEANHKIFCEKK